MVLKPALVLQRLFLFLAPLTMFDTAAAFVAVFGEAVSFLSPLAPAEDFRFVPDSQFQQVA